MEGHKFSAKKSPESHEEFAPLAQEAGALLESCTATISPRGETAASERIAETEQKIAELNALLQKFSDLEADERVYGQDYIVEELSKMVGTLENFIANIETAETRFNATQTSIAERREDNRAYGELRDAAEAEALALIADAPQPLGLDELITLKEPARQEYFAKRTRIIGEALAMHAKTIEGTTTAKDNSSRFLAEELSYLLKQEQDKMKKLSDEGYDLRTDVDGLREVLRSIRRST